MIVDIRMPNLGMTMERGKIISWSGREGDVVQKDSPLLTIETDKVSYEVSAPYTGYLSILVPAGEEVPVGGILGRLATTPEEYGWVKAEVKKSVEEKLDEPRVPSATPVAAAGKEGQLKISGIARKVATERGVDLTRIRGTGPEGRITKEDVLRAAEEKEKMKAFAPSLRSEGPDRTVFPEKKVKEIIPLTEMTKAMAHHMLHSLQSTAQVTNWEDVDMTAMMKLRENLLSLEDRLGVRISYTDIFIKIACWVLQETPLMNSSLEGEEIKVWEDMNLGIAVHLERGLVVPVIRQAQNKSLLDIAKERSLFISKAREGTLTINDVAGGTYTLSNLGSVGGTPGTPILVAGQMGIIAFGAVSKKPAVVDDRIGIRPMMRFASTVDHRVITGVMHHNFRMRWVRYLQEPSMELLGL